MGKTSGERSWRSERGISTNKGAVCQRRAFFAGGSSLVFSAASSASRFFFLSFLSDFSGLVGSSTYRREEMDAQQQVGERCGHDSSRSGGMESLKVAKRGSAACMPRTFFSFSSFSFLSFLSFLSFFSSFVAFSSFSFFNSLSACVQARQPWEQAMRRHSSKQFTLAILSVFFSLSFLISFSTCHQKETELRQSC